MTLRSVPPYTGLNPNELISELEALKRRLSRMEISDIPENQTFALAAEISAIRLHLKRLHLDREAASERVRAAPDNEQ